MSEPHQEHVVRIFDEARQLAAAPRTEFVHRACGTDDALRADVTSLLEADDASGEFMVRPALDLLAQAMAQERWSLHAGESIGPYTVIELLGTGGAGEVWRARDDRLRRDVAIKALLPHVASDADRLRRFAEEARVAGALNHPNILTVYDVGEHCGMPYLVSECLEGGSLRQRLDDGPISVEEALDITRGVARGLAAAHARSIVHRDLKPENTFITRGGGVKILDFGLAKLQSSFDGALVGPNRTTSGVIVGTAGYMAPEQVQGQTVDGRADLFALGAMLYEMLTGQSPFRRASTFETLHAVLTINPPDLSLSNVEMPAALAGIVARLIEKNPDARFQSALDVVWVLDHLETASKARPPTPAPALAREAAPRRSRVMMWTAILAAASLIVFLTGFLERQPIAEPHGPQLTRFTWPLPAGVGLGSAPAVSPDSRRIAFVGRTESASTLYVKDLGSNQAVPIPGTEGAAHPFWSPDGLSLGFFAGQRLMKVAWQGGAPVAVAPALFPYGGSWSPSGTMVYAPDVIMTGLSRVDAAGAVEQATLLDVALGDTSHCWPEFLPDGVHFLYFLRSVDDARRGVYVGRADQPATHTGVPLMRSESNAVYVPRHGSVDGVLLYVVDGRIEARHFDSSTLRFTGDARTIGVSLAGASLYQPAMLSASPDVLVFATSSVPYPGASRLEVVDRNGQRLRFWDHVEAQNMPRLSPDGRYLARTRVDELRNTPDIWVDDLERGPSLRVTTAVEPDLRPAWSPDGRYLAYVTGAVPGRPGKRILNIAAPDGTGVVRSIPCPGGEYCAPTDWTPQGLLINVLARGRAEVWLTPADASGPGRPLLAEPFEERDARMSRDGRWVAYVSSESGRAEVSVHSISGPVKRIAVSTDGGDHPVWRRDNSELFFVDPRGRLQSVAVQWRGEKGPTFGPPIKMSVPTVGRGHWGTPYDVSPDGTRIYFLRFNDDPLPRELNVVIGWHDLLD